MDPVGDLLVLAPDTPEVALVVEVKAVLADRRSAEARLKSYMLGNGCPVALLVAGGKTWMYRDPYADTEDSIEVVDEFDTALWLLRHVSGEVVELRSGCVGRGLWPVALASCAGEVVERRSERPSSG